MSIVLYSGVPGSGKSCHQAEDLIINLKFKNRLVIANYDINHKYIKHDNFLYIPNNLLSPGYLIWLADAWNEDHEFREGSIKLYIDEAQILFNPRDWSRSDRRPWLNFFMQHRKYGFKVFLISQSSRMLDRQIRDLIETECIHRKYSSLGIKGSIIGFLLGGNSYEAIYVFPALREKLYSETHHAIKKYYSLYDSYKRFD